MPVDKEEILFNNFVTNTIELYIRNNLWNQLTRLKIPDFIKYDVDRLNLVKKYINRNINPGLDLLVIESDGEIFFMLNKTEMYNHFNFTT